LTQSRDLCGDTAVAGADQGRVVVRSKLNRAKKGCDRHGHAFDAGQDFDDLDGIRVDQNEPAIVRETYRREPRAGGLKERISFNEGN